MMTVYVVQALKDHAHLSLSKAMSAVENLLAGHPVELTFDSVEERQAFRALALSLKVKCAD